MRKRLTLASKIVANIFIYLFVIVMVAGSIAMANASIINTSLKIPTYELVDFFSDFVIFQVVMWMFLIFHVFHPHPAMRSADREPLVPHATTKKAPAFQQRLRGKWLSG